MPKREHPLDWIDDELSSLDAHSLLRHLVAHQGPQGAHAEIAGQRCVNFGSNDYLGLAADPRVTSAAQRAIEREGWGSAASPLVAGRGAAHVRLEAELAQFEGTEAALLFSSGYTANLAAVTALASRGDAIFADEMNHASLIDGCRLSRAAVHVYAHGDCQQLEEMLRSAPVARRRLIVTDALFSMDGDFAPLVELADLAQRHQAMLLVDEAHATGVFGASGRGVAEHLGLTERIDIRVGTLSKALGGVGGFVCGGRSLVDWLVNRGRAHVFSTALPAAACAAASAALQIVRDEPERRHRLLSEAERLRGALMAAGYDVGHSRSQIIPLVLGDARRAVELAEQLFARGIYAPAIRPPSVPEGQSRLRISLSSAHGAEDIARLTGALEELRHARYATAAR